MSRSYRLFGILFLLLSLVMGVVLYKRSPQVLSDEPPAVDDREVSADSPPPVSVSSRVGAIVSVPGKTITHRDLNEYLQQSPDLTPQEALRALIEHYLLRAHAQELPDIRETHQAFIDAQVQQRLNTMKAQGMPVAYLKIMKERLQRHFYEKLQVDQFIQKEIAPDAFIAPREVIAFYEQQQRTTLPQVPKSYRFLRIHYVLSSQDLPLETIMENVITPLYNQLLENELGGEEVLKQYREEHPRSGRQLYIDGGVSPMYEPRYKESEIPAQLLEAFGEELDKWQVGDVSEPTVVEDEKKQKVIEFFYIAEICEAHVANLETDYQKIETLAYADRLRKKIEAWVRAHRQEIQWEDPAYEKMLNEL